MEALRCEDIIKKTKKRIQKRFKPHKEIKRIYPHRIIEAISYNRKYKKDRRAFGEFVGPKEIEDLSTTINDFMKRIKNPRSKGWADIFVIYMLGKNEEEIKKAHLLMKVKPVKHPRVMVAILKESSKLVDCLLTIKAIEILLEEKKYSSFQDELKKILEEHKKSLRDLVQWDNWSWFYMGGIVEKKKDITENGVISVFMEKMYNKSFFPHHKALSLHRRFTSVNRKKVRYAINRILDLEKPILITREARDGASEILRAASSLGLIYRVSSPGWEEEWEVKAEIAEDLPVKPLWGYLYSFVLGKCQAGEEVSFKDVMDKFLSPPYGTTAALLKLLFALFWRLYHHQVKLYNYGGGKRKEVGSLTFQRLTDMMRHPDNWKIGRRKESPEEEKYLRGVIAVFDKEKASQDIFESIWKEAKKSMLDWYDELPSLIHMQDFSNPNSLAFLKALKTHKRKNARDLFLNYIPSAFGFVPAHLNLAEDGENIAKNLQEAVEEINQKAEQFLNQVWDEVQKVFTDETYSEEEFKQKLLNWLKEIQSDKYSSHYRGDSKILYEIIKSLPDGEVKRAFLKDLPEKMGMKSVWSWEVDRRAEFIARLDKAKFHMEVMRYVYLKSSLSTDEKKEFIINWLSKVLKHLEFTSEEMEEFLESYLEKIAGG